jgi:IS30 family transposase
MSYKHLSQTERYQIHALLKAKLTYSEISDILGRHKSTISREILRNSGRRGYRPRQAELLCQQKALASRNARVTHPVIQDQVAYYLRLQWSPEQIAFTLPVSHETVYSYVYADKARGGSLWQHLRSQKKRRKRYAGGRDRRGQIIGRRPIADRPASVETRSHVGHWEDDTFIGAAHKHAIVTLVERKSGYAAITPSNASWQRGSNEKYNGLLRRYIPKKRKLSTVTDEELKMIQNLLNHRPRKRLGFKPPYQVFHESLNRVALRT